MTYQGEIAAVTPGSLADDLGLVPGDRLLAVNDQPVQDIIDLSFALADEYVELLIENECVLIDFQYMLEAQARRCLDFIDGASKVLTGNLQKVGSSMYLLTPINVVVDIEEIGLAHGNQEANFDFDMKRR